MPGIDYAVLNTEEEDFGSEDFGCGAFVVWREVVETLRQEGCRSCGNMQVSFTRTSRGFAEYSLNNELRITLFVFTETVVAETTDSYNIMRCTEWVNRHQLCFRMEI